MQELAKINKWLQAPNPPIHTVYSKIKTLLFVFVPPVALDSTKSITNSSNVRPLEEAVILFPGADFQKHYNDCQDHALLDSREFKEACKCMFNYNITLG